MTIKGGAVASGWPGLEEKWGAAWTVGRDRCGSSLVLCNARSLPATVSQRDAVVAQSLTDACGQFLTSEALIGLGSATALGYVTVDSI